MRFPTVTILVVACSIPNVLAQNLSKSYAPVYVDCPSDINFIRPASQGLNPMEAQWLYNRIRVATYALADYLHRLILPGLDVEAYLDALHKSDYSAAPTIAFAISGGGFTSALTGTGALNALDNRVNASNTAGTGGLLQSMSYFAGQSGGSWPPLSFATSNFPTADEILELWQPQIDRSTATKNTEHAATFDSMFLDIADKAKAGFKVSIADILGRTTGYEFVAGPKGGLNVTLSSIVNETKFKEWQMPFPIIQISQIVGSSPEALGIQLPSYNSTLVSTRPLHVVSC